jgi:amylosucrase/maltose alpha-D-glucosyltransferase/alpha-amylase
MDGDSRWVHRPVFPWQRAESRVQLESVPGRIYAGLLRLAQLRKQNAVFARSGETQFVDVGNDHVLGYFRLAEGPGVLVLANFTERAQEIEASRLRLLGLRKTVTDIVSGATIVATDKLVMEPYQFMVLIGVR